MKTLRNFFKSEREDFFKKFTSVQYVIPIEQVLGDNVFKIGKNKYSKTYKFSDINYFTLSEEDKEKIHAEYSKILNSLDGNSVTKITIYNRKIPTKNCEKEDTQEEKYDGLEKYRKERREKVENGYVHTIEGNSKDVCKERKYPIGSEIIRGYGTIN